MDTGAGPSRRYIHLEVGEEKSIASPTDPTPTSVTLLGLAPVDRASIESGSESNYKKKLLERSALFQRGDSEVHAGGSSR